VALLKIFTTRPKHEQAFFSKKPQKKSLREISQAYEFYCYFFMIADYC